MLNTDLTGFILQDARSLGNHMGEPYKSVFKAITDAGAVADVVVNGSGLTLLVNHVANELKRSR